MILWLLQRRRFWQQFQHPFITVLVLVLFIFPAVLIYFTSKSHSSTQLFNSDDTLKQVCENVVIPSITLRDSDAEMFEDNPQEYIKRDIEGSDRYTLLLLLLYYYYCYCNIVQQRYFTLISNIHATPQQHATSCGHRARQRPAQTLRRDRVRHIHRLHQPPPPAVRRQSR